MRSSISRWEVLLSILPAILVCDAAGILGLLIYTNNKTIIPNSGSLLALSICHFIITLSFPFALINNKISHIALFIITLLSGLAILGAGLSYLNLSLIQYNLIVANQNLFKAFNSLFLVSLITIGFSIGNIARHFNFEISIVDDLASNEEINEKFNPPQPNSISLKASAATLVDPNLNNLDNNSFMFSSISRIASKVNGSMQSINNNTLNEKKNDYSIKKLSIIKQSNSSTDILNIPEDNSEKEPIEHTATPVMSKIVDVQPQPSKNLLVERDALKRIPSVLLPPHLRPQEKTVFSNFNKLQDPINFEAERPILGKSKSHSNYNIPEEIIQEIPRSTTVQEMYPYLNDSKPGQLHTISLDDWNSKDDWFKKQEYLKSSSNSFQVLEPEQTFGKFLNEESDRFTITEPSEIDRFDNTSVFYDQQESSTEEVIKYVDNAIKNDDFYESGIDQSYSTLHLDDLYKQNSPQKSIFKSPTRRNSNNSFFSSSVPTSPRKGTRSSKSSPKKRRIKNLSLSSIVYKDEDKSIPNFPYVLELQRRQSAAHIEVKVPQTPIKETNNDSSKNTPESNKSHNPFPSEVIGQYDREKWKTLERLNLIHPTTEI